MSDEWQVTSDEQTETTAKFQEEERTQGFRDLLVWQKAMELTKAIYRISQEELRKMLNALRRKLVTRH